MNLLQVRTKFVDTSGRFDLVVDTTNYADNGANFFIQAGQRYLDTILPDPHRIRAHRVDIAAGDFQVYMKYLRWAEKVEIFNSEKLYAELEYMSWDDLQDLYTEHPSSMTQGVPADWAMGVHLPSPEQESLTSGDYSSTFSFDVDTLSFNALRKEQQGIEFRPTSSGTYTLKVTGAFFSKMEADTDQSYHSVVYPELSIMATRMTVEAFYRNSTGVNDWIQAMNLWLRGLDHNEVSGTMARVGNQISG